MQPEINQPESVIAPLQKVTPVSKYLAMALFVILPFIGGWIGYTFAPEKVVEVERVIEMTNVTEEDTLENNESFLLDESAQEKTIAFASYNKNGWSGAWMMVNDGNGWVKEEQIAGKFINTDAVLHNGKIYISVIDGIKSASGRYAPKIAIVDVRTQQVSYVNFDEDGTLVNFLVADNEVYAYVINKGTCLDVPATRKAEGCKGVMYAISEEGILSVSEQFDTLPAGKKLVAYNPVDQTLLFRDGYGDGGCVSAFFYTYDLRAKAIVNEERFGGCEDEGFTYAMFEAEVAKVEQQVKNDFLYHVYKNVVQNVTVSDGVIETNIEDVEIEEAKIITNILVN